MSEEVIGGVILGALGFAVMGLMFWMIADMAARGQVGRGVAYAFLLLFLWPVGLYVWLRTRSRYSRLVPAPPE